MLSLINGDWDNGTTEEQAVSHISIRVLENGYGFNVKVEKGEDELEDTLHNVGELRAFLEELGVI